MAQYHSARQRLRCLDTHPIHFVAGGEIPSTESYFYP